MNFVRKTVLISVWSTLLLAKNVFAYPIADFTVLGAIHDTGPFWVNEEILFDASATVFAQDSAGPDTKNRQGFNWDFGNGNRTHSNNGGRVVTQIYTSPGVYPVRLDVLDDEGRTDSVIKYITIEGVSPKLPPRVQRSNKALELMFDAQTLSDTSPHAHPVVWVPDGGDSAAYSDGISGKALDMANGYLRIPDSDELDGFTKGFAVSFWAKRQEERAEGMILYKEGAFWVKFFQSGNQNVFQASFRTKTGTPSSVIIANWFISGDTGWHHYVITLNEPKKQLEMYVDGFLREESGKNPRPFDDDLATSDNPLYIGATSSGSDRWTGCLDEVKIFNRSLTADELTYGFETLRGDFHARIRQRIDIHIPSDLTDDPANKLKITLVDTGTYRDVLFEKTSLSSWEAFIFDQSALNAAVYTLIYQVLDPQGNELDRYEEHFAKRYDGIPRVGIDENNSIYVDGEPFFPVTSFGLNSESIAEWTINRINKPWTQHAESAYPLINVLNNDGNWNQLFKSYGFGATERNPETWKLYMDYGASYGMKLFGPGRWPRGQWASAMYTDRYADPSAIVEYAQRFKDYPDLLAWNWDDEPDLGGPTECIPPGVVRAWSFLSQRYAPEQLTYTNLCGPSYVTAKSNTPYRYSWAATKNTVGRNKSISDIVGADYYPYDWRITRRSQNCSIAGLVEGLQRLRDENPYNPVSSFIEVADIRDDVRLIKGETNRAFFADLTPTIKPEQIKMLAWLHVVLGFKSINWFAYFCDFEGNWNNYNAMAEFTQQITELTPVVLGAPTAYQLTVNANEGIVRTLVREYKGKIYIITVRQTEMIGPHPDSQIVDGVIPPSGYFDKNGKWIEGGNLGDNVPVSDKSVTFTMDEVTDKTVMVWKEGRSLASTGNSFTDDFSECAVHIYVIEKELETDKEPDEKEIEEDHEVPNQEQTSENTYDTPLIAGWNLPQAINRQVSDTSGNGHTATLEGDISSESETGIRFDGGDGYMKIADADSLDMQGPMTITAWIQPMGKVPYSKIIVKPYAAYSSPWEMYAVDLGSSGDSPRFIVTDGVANGKNAVAANSSAKVQINQWHHLAAVYDGQSILLYLDSQLIAQADVPFRIGANTMPLCIGSRMGLNTFDGYISEVNIFDGAFTAEQVVKDYKTLRNRGLSGNWRFDQPYTSEVANETGGQPAQLIGEPEWGEGWAAEYFVRLNSGKQAVQIPLSGCSAEAGTIALWVQPEAASSVANPSALQVLFGHAVSSDANRITLYTVESTDGDGNTIHKLAIGLGDNAALSDNIAQLIPGRLYHIALTWDGTTYAVFVDGLQQDTGTFSGLTHLEAFADVGNLGTDSGRAYASGFCGIVDEIQLYRRALNAEEITRLFLTHTAKENRLIEFAVYGTDDAGNPIYYTAKNLPAGATFDAQKQTFSWRPALYQSAGNYEIVFAADGYRDQKITVSVKDTELAGWYIKFLESRGLH